MELQNKFSVPVGIEKAWGLLLDVEQVARCMPGAQLDSVNDDEVNGRVKVKLGPVAMTFQGTAKFVERDDAGYRIVVQAAGKDVRGSGSAKAEMVLKLIEQGARLTECTVDSDLTVSGKPAQFGRGVMADVSARIIDQFAERLAEEVEHLDKPVTAEHNKPVQERPQRERSAGGDAITLTNARGIASLMKVGLPAALLITALWFVLRRWR